MLDPSLGMKAKGRRSSSIDLGNDVQGIPKQTELYDLKLNCQEVTGKFFHEIIIKNKSIVKYD